LEGFKFRNNTCSDLLFVIWKFQQILLHLYSECLGFPSQNHHTLSFGDTPSIESRLQFSCGATKTGNLTIYIDFAVSHYKASNFISIFYLMIVLTISIGSKPMQYNKPTILWIHVKIKSLWIFFLEISWFISWHLNQTFYNPNPLTTFSTTCTQSRSWIFQYPPFNSHILESWTSEKNSPKNLNRLHFHVFTRFTPIVHPWCPKENKNPLKVLMQIGIHFPQ